MATTTYKILGQACPTGSSVRMAPGSGKQWVVSSIAITNNSASAATATLHACISNATKDTTNQLVKALSIPVGTMFPWTLGITLNGTDTLDLSSGTSGAIVFTVFGSEIIP